MNKQQNLDFSPEKKKINYYEENPKLVKKEKKRESLDNNKKNEFQENINNQNNVLNFEENINNKPGIVNSTNNCCISQPINNNNLQNDNDNKFCINNILDDFLNELEEEEKDKNQNCLYNNGGPIADELKGAFKRNKYNTYFQTSRTQNNQFSNMWDDFHQKRDKL